MASKNSVVGSWKCQYVWIAGRPHDPAERLVDQEQYDFHPGFVAYDNGAGVSFLYRYDVNPDGRSGTIHSSGNLGPEYESQFMLRDDGIMEMRMGATKGYFTYERISDTPRPVDTYPNLSESSKESFFGTHGQ